MTAIQFLIIAFAAFALARAVSQFRAGKLPRLWFVFWLFFWAAAVFVAVLPQTTDMVAQWVGVGRGADFITYISLIALFYLFFRLFIKIEDVERQLTRLVRKLAMEEFKNESDR